MVRDPSLRPIFRRLLFLRASRVPHEGHLGDALSLRYARSFVYRFFQANEQALHCQWIRARTFRFSMCQNPHTNLSGRSTLPGRPVGSQQKIDGGHT